MAIPARSCAIQLPPFEPLTQTISPGLGGVLLPRCFYK